MYSENPVPKEIQSANKRLKKKRKRKSTQEKSQTPESKRIPQKNGKGCGSNYLATLVRAEMLAMLSKVNISGKHTYSEKKQQPSKESHGQ